MVTLIRSIKWAIKSFFRHFSLSFITIIVITLSLFSLSILLFLNFVGKMTVESLQDRMDISVYLKDNLTIDQKDSLLNSLRDDTNIKELVYVSPEEALAKFKQQHQNEPLVLQSIDILSSNPLGGEIVLKAKSIDSYPAVLTKLNDSQYDKFIENKDFVEHQKIISTIQNISQKIYLVGLVIVLIFTLISIIAIFNSIRLTVYAREEEIKIMRLIGATSAFARTPLIIENLLYGFFAWIINLGIFFVVYKFGFEELINFLEIDKKIFFIHQPEIIYSLVGVLIFSVFLTIASSFAAVRKYIRT